MCSKCPPSWKIHWKLMIDRNSRIVFEISRPENIPQKWFSTQNEPLDVSFQMRLTPTMGAFYFLRKKTVTIMQCFKVFLKDFTVVFACFFKKSEPSMVGVSLIWKLTSKGSFWVLNHFWGIFSGRDIWKTILDFRTINIFQCIFIYFQNQGQKTNCL